MCKERKCARMAQSTRTFVNDDELERRGRMWVLAEREGFEPPIRLPVCRISSAVLSTTQPPLHRRSVNTRSAAMYPTHAR
jgi:hypothetical protein